jgi:Zinc knuckle
MLGKDEAAMSSTSGDSGSETSSGIHSIDVEQIVSHSGDDAGSASSYGSVISDSTIKLAPDANSITAAMEFLSRANKPPLNLCDNGSGQSTGLIWFDVAEKTRQVVKKRLSAFSIEKQQQLLACLSLEEILDFTGGFHVSDFDHKPVTFHDGNNDSMLQAHAGYQPSNKNGHAAGHHQNQNPRVDVSQPPFAAATSERMIPRKSVNYSWRPDAPQNHQPPSHSLFSDESSQEQRARPTGPNSKFKFICDLTRRMKIIDAQCQGELAPPPAKFFGEIEFDNGYSACDFLEAYLKHSPAARCGKLDAMFQNELPNFLDGWSKEWFKLEGFTYPDWFKFCYEFLLTFRNGSSDKIINHQIEQRRQRPGETFAQYVCAMNKLFGELFYSLSEADKLNRVISNLCPVYKNHIRGLHFYQMPELTKKMRDVDREVSEEKLWYRLEEPARKHDERDSYYCERSNKTGGENFLEPETFASHRQPPQQKLLPPHHFSAPPPAREPNANADKFERPPVSTNRPSTRSVECFNCHATGHYSRDCPRRAAPRRDGARDFPHSRYGQSNQQPN